MKFGLMSDVHLEFGDYDKTFGEGDVLLLAGDIHVAALLHSEHPQVREQEYRERSQRFIAKCLERYNQVFQVMGNHEHYNGIMDHSAKIIKHWIPDDRFQVLDGDTVQLSNGVLLHGGTLWTDFGDNDSQVKADAAWGMNDYRKITMEDKTVLEGYRRITPDDILVEHYAYRAKIRAAQARAMDTGAPLVVMTHHAPHENSVHKRFQNHPNGVLNPCYYTDLEHIMRAGHIHTWVHGHTHDNFDYQVHGTRVLCNPCGYTGGRNWRFKPTLSFEVNP